MRQTLGDQIQGTMVRARLLQEQRCAARVILARYGAVEGIVRWATIVLSADEIGHYNLAFRIAKRGVSC